MAKRGAAQKVAWFHAASLGEFEQGRPVIKAFRSEYPGYFLVLTFYSPSGYEIRKDYQGVDHVCYLPLDTARNAADFVGIVQPTIAFFIKYEFWHHYLETLSRIGTKVVLFAAIFRPGQIFFKSWGQFHRAMLAKFDVILVQNEASRSLVAGLPGVRAVQVAGDTRFDRVAQLVEAGRELLDIKEFTNGEPCLVVGSAWAQDMEVLIPVLNTKGRTLKAIIAPHEIDREQIGQWQAQLKLPSVRYSELKSQEGRHSGEPACYLFVDNIGMLSLLYRYGTMAYIGGAFGKGLHNTLEAATYGMPVFFGNRRYQRFSEALGLLELGIATAVGSAEELNAELTRLLDNPNELAAKSAAARQFVGRQIGATQLVMKAAKTLLDDDQSRNSASAR